MKESTSDIAVIGAGYGGICAASVLAQAKRSVSLFEAHCYLGGCASYFNRGEFSFDVGATTLSGIGKNRPISEWCDIVDFDLESRVKKIDPGIVVHAENNIFSSYTDLNLWFSELSKFGVSDKEKKFWLEVKKINERAWGLLRGLKKFPPKSLEDLFDLNFAAIKDLPLIPYLFESFHSVYQKRVGKLDPVKQRLIDQILLISTQTTSEKVPFLIGCMGISYPAETFYLPGGMRKLTELSNSLLYRHGVAVRKSHQVEKIKALDNGYEIMTSRGRYFAKRIISNLTIWNMIDVTEGDIKDYFKSLAKKQEKNCWGAFTLYFGIKCNQQFEELYHQVHTQEIPFCGSTSFFVSFSLADDPARAPQGYRCVTISTHCDITQWENLSKDDYQVQKEVTSQFILEHFFKTFTYLSASDMKYFSDGSPSTFLRYTGRYKGYVGGIPNTLDRKIWDMNAGHTPFEGLSLVGDTIFPGQGICGVIAGALTTCRSLC
jgi:phytoene dehydrogenase-like protein